MNKQIAYQNMLKTLKAISELPLHEIDDARNAAALEIAKRDARTAWEHGAKFALTPF